MKKLIRITTVPISLRILLKGQLKYMSSFFKVIAVSSDGKILKNVKTEEEVDIFPIKMSRKITPIADFISLIKLIKFLNKEKPEIVHTHTPKAGLLGMLSAYIIKIPIRMHTVAGMPLMTTTGLKKMLLIFIEKLTYALATNVYPNSKELQKYIIKNKLTKFDKLKIIGNGSSNGIDTEYFKLTEDVKVKAKNIKTELNITKEAFVFLFVGRIVKDKGVNELIKAFVKLKGDNLYLILVGEYEENLNPIDIEIAKQIKTNPKIIEVGFKKDVRPYFALSDVFVFPSYREGFPNVVMQAGAMELPSIVTDINGCNEIITHNENGLIIKVKNENEVYKAMKQFSNNVELTQKLKETCRENILKNYERNYIWEELKKEYNKLLSNINV